MKPITQTKLGVVSPDGQITAYGNCVAACIASITEIPLEDVPNVEVLMHCADWETILKHWLWYNGWDVKVVEFNDLDQSIPYMVSGRSPRAGRHRVIHQHGKLLHDPHPEGGDVFGDLIYHQITKNA